MRKKDTDQEGEAEDKDKKTDEGTDYKDKINDTIATLRMTNF